MSGWIQAAMQQNTISSLAIYVIPTVTVFSAVPTLLPHADLRSVRG